MIRFRLFSNHVVSSQNGLSLNSGLTLKDGVEYPLLISEMVNSIRGSAVTEQLKSSLLELSHDKRTSNLLVRHFSTNDDLGNAFRVLHAMKELGIPRERETYRYLMFGCCKYSDIELGLFVMENMLNDRVPDFRSFKKLFDTCAVNVDLRLWVAYDVMSWFYGLRGAPSAALKTTAYITEFMKTLGMRPSERAGRGYITLPHHRGDPEDVFEGMFEEDDPNYPEDHVFGIVEGEVTRLDVLSLIPEEFEDKNRLKQIVAANRRTEEQKAAFEEERELIMIDTAKWSVQSIVKTTSKERELEVDHIQKLKESRKKMMEERARPLPRYVMFKKKISFKITL